jgi:hypothetical protein
VPEAAPEPAAGEAAAEAPAPLEEGKPRSAITNVISLAQRIRSLHKDVKN